MRALLRTAWLLLCIAVVPPVLHAQAPSPEAAEQIARRAADPWLALVDAGEYSRAWQAAAPVFQQAINASQWEQAARQARGPLGELVSRTPLRTTYTTTLPNAPAGEYIVAEYTSAFETLPDAVETVVLSRVDDGTWKVAGTFVRPAR